MTRKVLIVEQQQRLAAEVAPEKNEEDSWPGSASKKRRERGPGARLSESGVAGFRCCSISICQGRTASLWPLN